VLVVVVLMTLMIDAASKQQYIAGYCITMEWNGMNTVPVYIAIKCNAT